jgi:hypothetical protein
MTKAAEAFTWAAISRGNREKFALGGTPLEVAGVAALAGHSARTEHAIPREALCAALLPRMV